MKFDDIRKLHQKKFREELGHFLIEGEHLVQELEKAAVRDPRLRASEVYVTHEYAGHQGMLPTQVINARLTGDGSRPALCFGAADEVADCVAEFGGGGVEGEGEGEGDEPPGGCGCGATSTADAAPLAVAALIALRRRQKRSSR